MKRHLTILFALAATFLTGGIGAGLAMGYTEAGLLKGMKGGEWEMGLQYDQRGLEIERVLSGGVVSRKSYDDAGRLNRHGVTSGGHETRKLRYSWGVNDRLIAITNDLTKKEAWFDYDTMGNLVGATYDNIEKLFRVPDAVTPAQMYDGQGVLTWEADFDIYGKVRTFAGSSLSDCPFRYQGQYEDAETGLYYNRFRYYDPESGGYLSQDPIRLNGGMQLYGYVNDPNCWIDVLGLNRRGNDATQAHIEEVRQKFMNDNPGAEHIGGGMRDGKALGETYIRPSNPIPGSTKGGSYADLTFKTESGQIVHINTLDKGNFNGSGMSRREYINANRIRTDAPNSIVITVRKGEAPGDLSVNKKNVSAVCH